MLISIIMPIYNGENYLEKAIDSVISQTYPNFELLLIDDKSTDDSVKIAEKYVKLDSRVKLYQNKKNLGICGTRNVGLKYAKGQFIGFIDNDDEFSQTLLEDNVNLLLKNNVDAVKFGRTLIDVNKEGAVLRENDTTFLMSEPVVYSEFEKYNKYSHFKQNGLLMNVWNGLYSNKVIKDNNLKFDETMRYGSEDAKFSYEFYQYSNNIVINPKTYYIHYRRDISSTSRKFNKNKIDALIKTARIESDIWDKIQESSEIDLVNNYKSNYIKIIISNQLLHKDSNLTFREKKEIIEEIISTKHLKIMNLVLTKKISLDNIFLVLMYTKNATLILIFYTLYKVRGGEKW